jgi:hypothetical protein
MNYLNMVIAMAIIAGSAWISAWAADVPACPPETPQRVTPAELQKMTNQERTNRIKELREKYQNMTGEQREAQRKIMRARMEEQIANLKKKKESDKLTELEAKRLEIMEQRLKLWDQTGKEGSKPALKPPESPKPAEK